MKILTRRFWFVPLLLLAVIASLIPMSIAFADNPPPPSGMPFDLFGVVQQLPSTTNLVGDWKVNNLTVHVSSTTVLVTNGKTITVGSFVHVVGRMQPDGTIQANQIALITMPSEFRFFGVIQSLPTNPQNGDWKVNDLTVHVTTSTVILPNAAAAVVGAYIVVQGTPQQDGSINASRIEILARDNDHHVKFVGVVKTLPASGLVGDWTVTIPFGGMPMPSMNPPVSQTVTVHVTADTKIDQDRGAVAVGVLVKIEGVVQLDKSVTAGSIETVFAPPTSGNVEFLGRIESLPASGLVGDWKVNDRTVHVTSSTKIDETHAKAVVGALVRVVGTAQPDKTINATEIEVRAGPTPPVITRYVKFFGIVQEVPASGTTGAYKINGLTVNANSSTEIVNGPIAKNSFVEVKGILQTDGTITAVRIEVKGTFKRNSVFGQSAAFGQMGK